MGSEEDDPFYSPRHDDYRYDNLAQFYVESEKHWKDNVVGKFSSEIGESLLSMDIEKSGLISILDMVRFINLESDGYFRSRDLELIFRRIGNGKQQISLN